MLQVESELTELTSEERTEYLKSLGVNESGLGNLIRATYSLLGLRTYFTSGEKVNKYLNVVLCDISLRSNVEGTCFILSQETKAWTILAG